MERHWYLLQIQHCTHFLEQSQRAATPSHEVEWLRTAVNQLLLCVAALVSDMGKDNA